jgi:hypothetical protein
MMWNGGAYDRERNNTGALVLADAARTISTNSASFRTFNARAVIVFFRISAAPAVPGVGGLAVGIVGQGPTGVESKFFMLPLPPAPYLQVTGTFAFAIGSGLPAAVPPETAFTALVNVPVPQHFFVHVAHLDAQPYTYEVTSCLVV